ncbi:carbohydrate ABC transporter substrate-binding protein [Cellulomonas sp. zg-ZUI222]|uniref:Carbohydrate ABC transporter substrate-binding protein n=1 Tax=Cellulomonas wangleii TaxID=2816956 RepID=A0ABX8D194_9CELL|nr:MULTISPECIES: ABC transporter substrate-binding protein [Cellulomonas]MBO0901974.1 carbohydrate ABC transporter substrate-binding protein [Cellulomonas sp. zg-ZUI22]MBO0922830.1 carbohydrate ABC transporter substrate-binding protein [Cellulomonas wangleii]MBO0925264.1 carbohydrate ABC transporter substrate-binding protein [Cellulomonas wangleii]QVI61234.1 carbohydrate ABC transporter substrate-binding protein [Cellulomonas wangleii]
MRKTTRKAWALAAGVTSIALVATACSSSNDAADDEGTADGGDITLTVATFNEFGYTDEMFDRYEAENPGVTVEQKVAATSNEARENLNTRLAAGSGTADIEAIEVDWLPELMQYPDYFEDLASPDVEGRWLEWKVKQATTPDGKLIGYGTDIGPEGIAYRADLFEAAGLPSDRESVAALFGGADATWDGFFEVGKQYTAATGKPFFDSASAVYQGMVNQEEAAYEDPDTGDVIALENPRIKEMYDQVTAAAVDDNLSAHFTQWSDDWTNSFQTDGFAAMLAPGWMLGVIAGNAAGVTGWDIADVFPGGSGNWGGSFLTVPSQGANVDAAKDLAAWLTAPEQQIEAFQNKGTFPSQVEALDSDEIKSATNEFFNNAPVGEILANRAKDVVVPFKGPQYFTIQDAISNAIVEVDVNGADRTAQWDTYVQVVEGLG